MTNLYTDAGRTREANHSRELAEALALLDVIRVHPLAVSGLTALTIKRKGQVLAVVTTDERACRHHLAEIGAIVHGPGDLAEALQLLRVGAAIRRIG